MTTQKQPTHATSIHIPDSFDNLATVDAPLQVRWGESDAAGITYYVNYFDWFTQGRTHYLKAYDMDYQTFVQSGIQLVAYDAYCRYYASTVPGMNVRIKTFLQVLKRTRMVFCYEIVSTADPSADERLVARGRTTHPFNTEKGPVNLARYRPQLWKRLTTRLPVQK